MAVASSSKSSSIVSSKKYDVFLSFRGEDTRRNFTSHLYDNLKQKYVETFIDNEELEKGDEISPALIKAIEDSHVSIVIFSENYATSKWCLNELSEIMDNCTKDKEQVVIPVFYDIDPSHVRNQTGSFEEAFKKHKEDKKCSKWKAALTEAANLAGFHSRAYKTDPELIKGIVTDVLQKLKLDYPTELENLVGIDRKCAEVESLLKIGSGEVRMIGIWGMGGIGKTTLASALYVKLRSQFDGCCFLASVRERSANCSIHVLRNELYSKLLKEENLHLDPGVEADFVTIRLHRGKFLIVLDDVASFEQLEKLIKDYKGFRAGSRVIVTTRNQQIIKPVKGSEIYEVTELDFENSLELFCLKAFGEKHPRPKFADLSKRAIHYCKGNPLVLKVLGASLYSKGTNVWESKLEKLKMIQNEQIVNVLKLSYDDLERDAQNIFLDIACYFKGWNRDKITNILEGDFAAESGIEVLLDKALISVSCYGNTIEMHDLIQELGQDIVDRGPMNKQPMKPGERSRLWRHEEVCKVLEHNRGTEAVEGITLDLSKLTRDLNLRSDSFSSMTEMRFLGIYGDMTEMIFPGIYGDKNKFNVRLPKGLDSLSDRLSYLCWNRFCLQSLPSNFCAENLVELNMRSSKLKKLWDGVQNMVNLKIFDLAESRDLVKIPDLSKAKNLEIATLYGCKSLCELHPSKLSLPKLKELGLERCKRIRSFILDCPSLKILYLGGCSSLTEFSVTSEELWNLTLTHTPIGELPSSIKKIGELSLWGCKKMAMALPHIIDQLSFLRELDLRETNVESLPANIKYLSMLQVLELDECRRLRSLPELPPFLRELSTSNCTSLETDFTQQLVLQYMLRSYIPSFRGDDDPYNRDFEYFLCPGDSVTDESWFRTGKSSITVPYHPISNFCGFIFCITLSKGLSSEAGSFRCSICEDGVEDGVGANTMEEDNLLMKEGNFSLCPYFEKLALDHTLFWYLDLRVFQEFRGYKKSFFSTATFKFRLKRHFPEVGYSDEGIKGCGVFPVYASASGLKLLSRSYKEIFESDSIIQISENEDDSKQLLPASKRRRLRGDYTSSDSRSLFASLVYLNKLEKIGEK